MHTEKKSKSFLQQAIYPALFLVIVAACFFGRTSKMQSVSWTYPYASGAANLSMSLDWKISPEEYYKIANMPADVYRSYRHMASPSAISNDHNNLGYVLVIFAARNIFFWMGDLNATVLLQILLHAIFSISIIRNLRNDRQRAFFFFLYALNPVITGFVTFPFYYFWSVVPCYFFCILYLKKKKPHYELLYIVPLLYLAFLIRPTTILVSLAFFVLLLSFDHTRFRMQGIFALLCFCLMCVFLKKAPGGKQESAVWHTAYIGLSAYPNKYNINLSDEFAFGQYAQEKNITISTNPVNGFFRDHAKKNAYYSWLKGKYFNIVKGDKWVITKNAFLNVCASFGLGYFTQHIALSLLSSLIGIIFIVFLLYKRMYSLGCCILASCLTYALYYPPIPSYNFGTYLPVLLAMSIFLAWLPGYVQQKMLRRRQAV
jgi:hypothetical protein